MMTVATNLNTTASIINLHDVTVGFRQLAHRSKKTFAAATKPAGLGGWQAFHSVAEARNRSFRLWLDIRWNSAPIHRSDAEKDSRFQTLVHEFTHMVLNTDDIPGSYGYDEALDLAVQDSDSAKKNADNWGYFVEEIRHAGT